MNDSQTKQLQQFISDHKLKNEEGIIHFEATVSFYKEDILRRISSSVQIITLPEELALYIIEFIREEYNQPEMYSTKKFLFSYYSFNLLEIRNESSKTAPIISIELAGKTKAPQAAEKSGITN